MEPMQDRPLAAVPSPPRGPRHITPFTSKAPAAATPVRPDPIGDWVNEGGAAGDTDQ